MPQKTLKIAVTGAAGQVAYAFLPRLCAGEVFGKDTNIILHLLETPNSLNILKGVVMELQDGAFPLLKKIVSTDQAEEAFAEVNWAFLIGAKPRKHGMQRGELLSSNGPIFKEQGEALSKVAAKDVRVVVVGNPANTNCLIAINYAKNISPRKFSALTYLDYNRAKTQLALKAGVGVEDVTNLTIWGNHSFTQYPDFSNVKIKGQPLEEVIKDQIWLKGEFISTLQERGAMIIEARGSSSAFSAANSVIDHVKSLNTKTPENDRFSAAIPSDGSYGVDPGLVFSFPVRSDGQGNYEIVQNISLTDFAKEKIAITLDELRKEKDLVKDLLV